MQKLDFHLLGSWPSVENRLLPPYWSDQYNRSNWQGHFVTVTRVSCMIEAEPAITGIFRPIILSSMEQMIC